MSDDRKCGCRGAYVSCDLCNPDEATTLLASLAAAEREVERLQGVNAAPLANIDFWKHRALAAERARDEAVAALREIVAEWEKDAEGAEECFPLLARARAVLEGGR